MGGDRLVGRMGCSQPLLFLWRVQFTKCPDGVPWLESVVQVSGVSWLLHRCGPCGSREVDRRSRAQALGNVGLCGEEPGPTISPMPLDRFSFVG